ncbi:MAG: hypothetical protein KY462_05580 [Actinobacteria bacterium]|nr:hypothetical protein [Actinomycetota bacterium]
MTSVDGRARLRDSAAANRHVAVVDGALRVTDWRTGAPEVVRYFEDRLAEDAGGDLADVLEAALKVGVVALSTAGVSVNVDVVDKEFQRLARQLQDVLEERVRQLHEALDAAFSEDGGALRTALERYLGQDGAVAELFDPNRRDSAVSRIRDLLAEHLDGDDSTLHRILDVTDRSSPLTSWKEQIDGGFERLRRQLEDYRRDISEHAAAERAASQARADEREKGTAKGRAYEELVFAAVSRIAAVLGDTTEPTGDATGVGGRKVGDVVVTLNGRDTRGATVRLVFEAKDAAVGLTPILRELEHARDNRGAAAAIAVYSREAHLPSGASPFREHGGGRYLCLLDKDTEDALCLQVAYRLARFWALADLADDGGDVDVRSVRDDVEAARHQLQNISSAKSALTRMRNAVDEAVTGVHGQLETFRADLLELLDRIDGRIRLSGDT